MTLTEGVTRGALVAELSEVVGAPHEARFIVDEVLGLGLVLGHPGPPTGPLSEAAVASARRISRGRRARSSSCSVRTQARARSAVSRDTS